MNDRMTPPPSLLWFRADLRLDDHPALHAALAGGGAVIPVFILDDEAAGSWAPGGAARWWLHHSLAALDAHLRARGSQLLLRRGRAETILAELACQTGARAVQASRATAPWARRQESRVQAALQAAGTALHLHDGTLLHDPATLRTGAGGPYVVYTPFSRAARQALIPGDPLPAPAKISSPALHGTALGALKLLPTRPDWASGLRAAWTPGAAGALQRLTDFLDAALDRYAGARDRPDIDGTSMLSPHLAWGEISPRRIWHALACQPAGQGAEKFAAELLWREFSHHLLWHSPHMPNQPLRPHFARLGWRDDPASRAAWQRGCTGIPIVDAGMRQLWQTGWMHNRVRMIVASLLTKHLLIPWQQGEAWFWDTLVDADLANNAASWQWVAGCGADAAPFFRIFNPVLQGAKFDPDGAYVRRYVPELGKLPTAHLHAPWLAPPAILAAASIRLGATYPHPIVDLAAGRARALAAYADIGARTGAAPAAGK